MRLWQEPNGLPAGDVIAHIAQVTPLFPNEVELLPDTHTPRYERAVRLATAQFVKAGWLVKNKGRWYITEAGKRACKGFPNAQAFHQEAGRILDEWRETKAGLGLITEDAEEKAWEQMRTYLQSLQPYEFQVLAGDLLRALGYHLTWVAPPEKDRGFISFVLHTDPLGMTPPRIKVHVLHTGQPVMFEGLKGFMSILGSDDAGIFVSSGGFTGSVMEEALAQRLLRITLIDLEHFYDLWLEYYDKLTVEARGRFPLKPVYFLAPA
jgi:restriction system protein